MSDQSIMAWLVIVLLGLCALSSASDLADDCSSGAAEVGR